MKNYKTGFIRHLEYDLLIIVVCACQVITPTSSPTTQAPLYPQPTVTVSPTPSLSTTPLPNTGMKLIFQDEFNGSAINTAIWATKFWWSHTNPPELGYYTPDALKLNNGALSIIAEKRHLGGMNYTTGIITSRESFVFTYGYVEIRAKIPAGKGLWSAFWTTTKGSDSGEIDFEWLGQQPESVYTTHHWGKNSETQRVDGPDFSKDFHVFAFNWEPNQITWYMDGTEIHSTTQHIPSLPQYLVLNLAVGGDWPGAPEESTLFPANYQIDYIRVYQQQK
jgi:beta-glucanase (GH16 family)